MIFPYKDTNSRIHKLDARPKIVFVAAMFVMSVLLSDIFYLAILFLFILLVAVAGRVLRSTLSLLKYTAYMIPFVFLFNLLIPQGYDVVFTYGIIRITSESIWFATSMCFRLFVAVGSFSLLAFIVHPDEALRAMSRFGHKTTTSFSLATRMYPTIATDSKNIMDAMRVRGVEFDEGGALKKAQARSPVVMPLLMNSLERSVGISEAMEARGFGSGKRTSYIIARITTREIAMVISFVAAMFFAVAMFIVGHGHVDYLAGEMTSPSLLDFEIIGVILLLLSPIFLGGRK
ncbi:MAG TPA: energy-coupling factor transporter transmembrane component T [Methanomassiliicoccales archaeon]|jgi:energy-coupling factor transport system permease protein